MRNIIIKHLFNNLYSSLCGYPIPFNVKKIFEGIYLVAIIQANQNKSNVLYYHYVYYIPLFWDILFIFFRNEL